MPSLILADLVWPALYLADRMVAFEVIVVGILIEFFILHRSLNISWQRAAVAVGVMNLVSSLVGVPLIPAWGWHWESVVHARNRANGWGTFNPLTWAETYCLACLLTTLVEIGPARLLIGPPKHLMSILLLANALSVAVAFFSTSHTREPFWPAISEWLMFL